MFGSMVILGSKPYLGLRMSNIAFTMETGVTVGPVMEDVAKRLGRRLARVITVWREMTYKRVLSRRRGFWY
jgi:hypothetical protein